MRPSCDQHHVKRGIVIMVPKKLSNRVGKIQTNPLEDAPLQFFPRVGSAGAYESVTAMQTLNSMSKYESPRPLVSFVLSNFLSKHHVEKENSSQSIKIMLLLLSNRSNICIYGNTTS